MVSTLWFIETVLLVPLASLSGSFADDAIKLTASIDGVKMLSQKEKLCQVLQRHGDARGQSQPTQGRIMLAACRDPTAAGHGFGSGYYLSCSKP
jgi:hypothetical protein